VIRYGRRRGKSHLDEYDKVDDGRLILGTPCFSGVRLKRRFENRSQANKWLKKNEDRYPQKLIPYACHMCGGFHLTTRKKGKK
jgi:hypothetical protein